MHVTLNDSSVDDLLDNVNNMGGERTILGADYVCEETRRRAFAGLAARISDDRYSGGSNGAISAIIIMHKHGVKAAIDFAKDLQHHEG